MKQSVVLFVCIILLAGCSVRSISTVAPEEPALAVRPTVEISGENAKAAVSPSPNIAKTPITATEPTATATIPAEARLKVQCMEITPTLPKTVKSKGIVVVQGLKGVRGLRSDAFLLDMATGKSVQINRAGEDQLHHRVSPDQKRVAYIQDTLDTEGKTAKRELVVADATGKRLETFPWGADWADFSGWLDDRRLGVALKSNDPDVMALRKPGPILIVDLQNEAREVLASDYPGFLQGPSTVLPDWEGWYGVVYDATFTLAVYPRFLDGDDERYTYAVWDLSKQRLAGSLEPIFTTFSSYNYFPMPRWSPDGTRFIFKGVIGATDPSAEKADFDLYSVSRDGQTKKMTNLADVASIWETGYSWSPDGRYIALYLGPKLGADYEKARVAVLDTVTLDVTDTCLLISFKGEKYGDRYPPAPVWSPDSRQFLVMDWYEQDHSDLILVDIERGAAAEVAQDVGVEGWMIAPGE